MLALKKKCLSNVFIAGKKYREISKKTKKKKKSFP